MARLVRIGANIVGWQQGRSHCVMAGFMPAIHDFAAISTAGRGWPGQARP
jgi:hypothetical protein